METVMITAEEAKRITLSSKLDSMFAFIMSQIKEHAVEGKRFYCYRVEYFEDGGDIDKVYSKLGELGYCCNRHDCTGDYKELLIEW